MSEWISPDKSDHCSHIVHDTFTTIEIESI